MSDTTTIDAAATSRHDLTEFVTTGGRTLVRTSPFVLVVLMLTGAPLVWLLREALEKFVHVRNVITVLNRAQDTPTDAVGGLIATTTGIEQSFLGLVVAAAIYVVIGLPVIMHVSTSSVRGNSRFRTSMASGFCRLHRILPAVLVMGLIGSLALAAGPATFAYLLLNGAASWQEPLQVAVLVGCVSLGLAIWAGTRLAFLVPVAVSGPSRSFTLGRALKATRERWWETFTRLALSGLTCTALTGVTWSLLIPWLSAGTEAQVTAAILIAVSAPIAMGAVFSVLLGVGWALAAEDSGAGEPSRRAAMRLQRGAQARHSQAELLVGVGS